MIYRWKDESPVRLIPQMHLARFTVDNFETLNGGEKSVGKLLTFLKQTWKRLIFFCLYISDGSSLILLKFRLTRDHRYYNFAMFVPCILLVILGWFSLWISRFEPAGRAIVIMGKLVN